MSTEIIRSGSAIRVQVDNGEIANDAAAAKAASESAVATLGKLFSQGKLSADELLGISAALSRSPSADLTQISAQDQTIEQVKYSNGLVAGTAARFVKDKDQANRSPTAWRKQDRNGVWFLLDERGCDIRALGAPCNGIDDDQPFVQAAADYSAATGAIVLLPGGDAVTRLNSAVKLTERGVKIEGVSGRRSSVRGSQVAVYGQEGFVVGVPDSFDWNSGKPGDTVGTTYNGPQDQYFKSVAISAMNRGTPLELTGAAANAFSYRAGSYGIRDWRAGGVYLEDVFIEGFEYNFHGINSDINHWLRVVSLYSKYGIYIGPRSDQFTIDYLYSFYNERAVTVDGADQVVLNSAILVGNGNSTAAMVEVRRGSGSVRLNDPWKEQLGGRVINGLAGSHLVSVGTVQGYGASDQAVPLVSVTNPLFYGTDISLVALGRGYASVKDPAPFRGSGFNLLTSLFYTAADQSWGNDGQGVLEGVNLGAIIGKNGTRLSTNLGGGNPRISYRSNLNHIHYLASKQAWQLTLVDMSGVAGADEATITAGGVSGRFAVSYPSLTNGLTDRLVFTRAIQHVSAGLLTGNYKVGDKGLNNAPSSVNPVVERVAIADGGAQPATSFVTLRGTTGSRPNLTTNDTGVMYMDTTLATAGKPVWWNGSGSWVDATGTVS